MHRGNTMKTLLKKLSPARIIALGFASAILIGSVLFMLPCSTNDGVVFTYADALYMSTSAVCVTGLATVDPGSAFTPFGQAVLLSLVQIGGLGVTSIGAGVILALGKKMNLKGRTLIREAMNLDSGKGAVRFVRDIFVTTLIIELAGAILSFPVFIRDYSLGRAVWLSVFHSVAAFNNSGFDILGYGNSLASYSADIVLNLVTCALIFLGGIGFLVIKEVIAKRFEWKKFSMHTKVVLFVSAVLTVAGTILLRFSTDITWLGAFFNSVTARTAGFATFPLSDFSGGALLVMIILMFIGASPGSTGGGIKTSTFFVIVTAVIASATNRSERAFRYSIPKTAFRKASVIAAIAIAVILTATFALCVLEPQISIEDILFEMTSAFATVGLSTGITPTLSLPSKLISVCVMYMGRLGPLTVATLWYFSKGERVSCPEGNLTIG